MSNDKLPMTSDEMNKAVTESKRERTYSPALTKEVRDENISRSIVAHEIMHNEIVKNGRIRLSDDNLDVIVQRSQMYLDSCALNSILPNMLSYSTFVTGYSARSLRRWLSKNENTEVSKYISEIRELIGSIQLDNALKRNTSEAVTIFSLRNHHGFVNDDISEVEEPVSEESKTPEELMKKYSNIDLDLEK